MVSGTTQVVAVIGHPIAQVKSPDNFNRYFMFHGYSFRVPRSYDFTFVIHNIHIIRKYFHRAIYDILRNF